MDPLLWLVILAIFLIIEAVTVGLVTVWFAGGALLAAIASAAGADIIHSTVDIVSDCITDIIDFYQAACCQVYETGSYQNKCE